SEVLHPAPLIPLPSNPLTASPGTAANPASGASSTPPLAVPSSSQTLKNPDPRFIECEAFTNRFAAHLSGPFGKSHKRVVRKLSGTYGAHNFVATAESGEETPILKTEALIDLRWTLPKSQPRRDLANDYAELGALYNVFSLNESGNLASAIEKVGQAVDASYVFSSSVVTALEAEVSEPLQEYEMFAQIIKSVLKYRRLKHVQVEQAAETLAQKRVTLESLEHVENEARRIDELLRGAVGGGGGGLGSQRSAGAAPPTRPDGGSGAAEERTTLEHAPTSPNRELSVPGSAASGRYAYGYGGPGPRSRSPNIRIGSGSKLINALSHRIQGMMDVDPEATRRNNIGKTRDAIALVRVSPSAAAERERLQEELNRFQNVKVADFRDILLAFSNIHHKWCQKVRGCHDVRFPGVLLGRGRGAKRREDGFARISVLKKKKDLTPLTLVYINCYPQ
ncbi:MAG: hypothetical protein BJ554DRAFT_7351, partial [Olpidium bornovanus]